MEEQTTWTGHYVSLNLNLKKSTAPVVEAKAKLDQSHPRTTGYRTVVSRERERERANYEFLLLQPLEASFDLILRKETSHSRY